MPPNINQTTDANSPTAAVTWTPPTASDDTGVYTLTSTFQPGDPFPIGITAVTYSVVDAWGNLVTSSFNVAVTGKYLGIDDDY